MSSRWLVSYIEEEFDRRREEELRATLRRPDALPLLPAEPRASAGDRVSRMIDRLLGRLPAPVDSPKRAIATARSARELGAGARPVRR